MKAVLSRDPSNRQLEVGEVPVPVPGDGQILVQVYAAGLIPTEVAWYPTTHTKDGAQRLGAIPGHEFSGVVRAIGTNVHDVTPGNPVFGMNDWFAQGAMAEFCVAGVSEIAPMPKRLSYAEAASVPISALTAWQGLFDRLKLKCGERLLVHGGAGSVGAYVIQLAKLHGAEVIATGGPHSVEYLKSLGADQVMDYSSGRFEDCLTSGVDAMFDTVGGETLQRSWAVLPSHGRAVTIVENKDIDLNERVRDAFFIVEPSRSQLIDISVLLDGGSLAPAVKAQIPLVEAPAAYFHPAPQANHGKIVVLVKPEP